MDTGFLPSQPFLYMVLLGSMILFYAFWVDFAPVCPWGELGLMGSAARVLWEHFPGSPSLGPVSS